MTRRVCWNLFLSTAAMAEEGVRGVRDALVADGDETALRELTDATEKKVPRGTAEMSEVRVTRLAGAKATGRERAKRIKAEEYNILLVL
jgi:hypothetical protein